MGPSKEGAAQADRAGKELSGKESSWVSSACLKEWGHCIITTLRPSSRDSIKKQHRNDFASLATSMFLMLRNSLYTQGSKRKMLIIPIKDHLWEISSRLEVISPLQLRWTSMVTFCLKALVHLCVKALNPQSYSRFGCQKRMFIYELATKYAAAATIQSQLNSFSLAMEHRG